MARSVFISRDLNKDDILLTGLRNAGFRVFARSLIGIQPIPFQTPEQDHDWIFLASSNAAKLFLPSYSGHAKIATAGSATADTVRNLEFEVSFQGSGGDMEKVGKDLAIVVGGASILFPKAEGGSRKVISQFVPEQVTELPIYSTIARSDVEIPDTDIVFLTSPSNAEAYLSLGNSESKKFVAIGNTTAEYLKDNGIKNVLIPESPESESILRCILST